MDLEAGRRVRLEGWSDLVYGWRAIAMNRLAKLSMSFFDHSYLCNII